MYIWAKIALALLLATPAAAQQWLGARAGMINYAEGVFYLDQEQLKFPATRFREMAKGQVLSTSQGWVEVQLGPNAFLWMGEGGMLRMEDPTLTNETQRRLQIEQLQRDAEVWRQMNDARSPDSQEGHAQLPYAR